MDPIWGNKMGIPGPGPERIEKKVELHSGVQAHHVSNHPEGRRGSDLLSALSFHNHDRVPVFSVVNSLGIDPEKATAFIIDLHAQGIKTLSRAEIEKLQARFNPSGYYTPGLVEEAFAESFGIEVKMAPTIEAFRTDVLHPDIFLTDRLKDQDLEPKEILRFLNRYAIDTKKAISDLQQEGIPISSDDFIGYVVRGFNEIGFTDRLEMSDITPKELIATAFRIGRTYEIAVGKGIVEPEEFTSFVHVFQKDKTFKAAIVEAFSDKPSVEHFFVGVRVFEIRIDSMKAEDIDSAIHTGRRFASIKDAIDRNDIERIEKYLASDPELTERALEEQGAESISTVIVIAERVAFSSVIKIDDSDKPIKRFDVEWGTKVVKRIYEHSKRSKNVIHEILKHVEHSQVAEEALSTMDSALTEVLNSYLSAKPRSGLSRVLIRVLKRLIKNANASNIRTIEAAIFEKEEETKAMTQSPINDLLIGLAETARSYSNDFAILDFAHKDIFRRTEQALLAERKYIDNEAIKAAAFEVSLIIVSIKRAFESGDFAAIERLSGELQAIISKGLVVVPADVRYMLGFVGAKVDPTTKERSVQDSKFVVVSSDHEGPLSLVRVQTIAEAEINMALNDEFKPSQEAEMSAEVVVYSNIIKNTAMTTKAKSILNTIMNDASLWADLEQLSQAGKYDEVRQIIKSVVHAARTNDRYLGHDSIISGIQSTKEQQAFPLAA